MLLQKTRDHNGDIMVSPVFTRDNPMFKHCTNGTINFPNKHFKKHLLPVLLQHGFIDTRVKAMGREK